MFAVDYSPGGQGDPGAAVDAYFLFGPLGGFGGLGRAKDSIDFDRVLCGARRDRLHRQAAAFARDLGRPGILRIEPLAGEQVTTHGTLRRPWSVRSRSMPWPALPAAP